MSDSEPVERVSGHYLGDAGQRYVSERQSSPDHIGFAINLEYFRPYLKQTDVVLDFGCGNGGMLRLMRGIVARAEGIEVNPAARAVAMQSGCRIHSALEEVADEPEYDVIVSNHVLEHVRDVCGTLERLRRRLKSGGLFVTKLPLDDFRNPHQREFSRDDVDHHLQTWTPRLFANTLYESGFQVRECRVVTSAWHPRLFPLVRWGLGPLAFWALAVIKRRRQLFAVAERVD